MMLVVDYRKRASADELLNTNIIKNANNVFVLSKEQIEKYYPDNEKRVKRITAYAKKERVKDGVNIHDEDYSFYWISTVDGIKNCCVLNDGDFYFMRSEAEFIGVAPAIMIKK